MFDLVESSSRIIFQPKSSFRQRVSEIFFAKTKGLHFLRVDKFNFFIPAV